MNPSVLLTIEMPELSDEAAASLQEVFYTLLDAFDANYYHQITRHYRQSLCSSGLVEPQKNQDPF